MLSSLFNRFKPKFVQWLSTNLENILWGGNGCGIRVRDRQFYHFFFIDLTIRMILTKFCITIGHKSRRNTVKLDIARRRF